MARWLLRGGCVRCIETTQDGRLKGKFAYMAPEQIKRGLITRRTDVFSASIVLWETLTAHRLFVGETEADLMMGVLSAGIEPPSELRHDLGDRYDAVTMRGLERDASLRFATAEEMAIALERCGEVATPSEVAAWLTSVAGDRLRQRADTLAQIESGVRPPTQNQLSLGLRDDADRSVDQAVDAAAIATNGAIDLARMRSPWRRRRAVMIAVIAGLLLVVTTLVVVGTRRADRSAEPASSASATSAAPLSAIAQAAGSPSPVVSATVKTTPIARPTLKPAASSPRKPACSPPYTVDSLGHHHYKIECL